MKLIKSKIAILAIALSAAGPLLAGELVPVRNCTWCHGTSAEGYATAPRLAGQRDLYIESQLLNFHSHIRDNPYSKDYMWAAVANISPEMAHDFAAYFSRLPPEAANDGDRTLVAAGQTIYEKVFRSPISSPASSVMAHALRASGRFPV